VVWVIPESLPTWAGYQISTGLLPPVIESIAVFTPTGQGPATEGSAETESSLVLPQPATSVGGGPPLLLEELVEPLLEVLLPEELVEPLLEVPLLVPELEAPPEPEPPPPPLLLVSPPDPPPFDPPPLDSPPFDAPPFDAPLEPPPKFWLGLPPPELEHEATTTTHPRTAARVNFMIVYLSPTLARSCGRAVTPGAS
jgi:hypothetical protein